MAQASHDRTEGGPGMGPRTRVPDGYTVFDFAGSTSQSSPIKGQQWRAKAVLSWKVEGCTRQSTTRTTPVLGYC